MNDSVKSALKEIKYCIEQETRHMTDQDYAELIGDLWLVAARLRTNQTMLKAIDETNQFLHQRHPL